MKQLINDILKIASKHILVGDTLYKRELNINDGHNHKYYQYLIDNEGLITERTPSTLEYATNITVLGIPTDSIPVIEVQDTALHILLDTLEMIGDTLENVEVGNINVMYLTEYSDDNCSGIRASVSFIIPKPINLCEYQNHFIDKEETTEDNDNINLDATNTTNKKDKQITLNPLKLY